MKKLLLLGAGLFFAFTAPAEARDMYNNYHNNTSNMTGPLTGVYLGVYGGYSWNNTDTGVTGVDFDADGGEYGAMVGLQVDTLLNNTVNRLGLGLNGAMEIYYTESNADDDSGPFSLEKDYDYGISFRPGLTIIDKYTPFGLKPYGILGYRRANFDTNGAGLPDDKTLNGFELGAGTEVLAYDRFGVRVDYTHVFYAERDGLDPDEDNVRLGVAYHF